MPRVKTGTTRRKSHKKILKLARGYRMTRNRLYKVANEAVLHAGAYAYRGRKERKRQFRRLWISRINAALMQYPNHLSYSRFINLLKLNKIILNRKSLSQLAIKYPQAFKAVYDLTYEAKSNLNPKTAK